MRLSLRSKLTLAYLIPVLVLGLVVGTLAYRAARRALEEELGQRLSAIAQTVSGHLEATRDGGRLARLDLDPESSVRGRLNEWLGALQQATQVRRIFVFRASPTDGEPIALLDSDPGVVPGTTLFDLAPDRAELANLLEGRAPAGALDPLSG